MKPLHVCAVAVGAMLALALISSASTQSSAAPLRPRALRAIMRQSARAATLADQDSNAVMSMTHASYALAYVTAARRMASDRKLRQLTGIDAAELEHAADEKQRRALAHINAGCPELAVRSDQLRMAGWLP